MFACQSDPSPTFSGFSFKPDNIVPDRIGDEIRYGLIGYKGKHDPSPEISDLLNLLYDPARAGQIRSPTDNL